MPSSPRKRSPSPPSSDPEARWAIKRAAWLARRRPEPPISTPTPPPRDPIFATRLQLLDQMLTNPSAHKRLPLSSDAAAVDTPGSSSGLLLNSNAEGNGKGKGKEVGEEDRELLAMEPDGGDVIARRSPSPFATADSERAIEGIMTAFRLGRALKEPLPLSIVTKILYHNWLVDGTIPPDYERSLAAEKLNIPEPIPDNYPRPARPHWLESSAKPKAATSVTPTSTAAEWVPPSERTA